MNYVSIIRDDNIVVIDGVARSVNCSSMDENIHAVQFDMQAGVGHIEFYNNPFVHTGDAFRANGKIDSIAEWQSLLNAWAVAK